MFTINILDYRFQISMLNDGYYDDHEEEEHT